VTLTVRYTYLFDGGRLDKDVRYTLATDNAKLLTSVAGIICISNSRVQSIHTRTIILSLTIQMSARELRFMAALKP